MKHPIPHAVAFAIAVASPHARAADSTAAPTQPDPTTVTVAQAEPANAPSATNTPSAPSAQRIEITGARERLDAARNGLSPDTGSTLYRFRQADIANLPLGASTPLNDVILQSPGVVQDAYGQLHVRGDHANVQYRINGVIIPEAISGFGQALETRFADQISILTGALPAQYGYRTAAVVDIRTQDKGDPPGGSIGIVGGSRGHAEGNLSLDGTVERFSYHLTGSYLRNDIGIENPTPERNALHDRTRQTKGFGSLSYLLGDDSRVSLLFGSTDNRFQIPDVRGAAPAFDLAGTAAKPSDQLDANQRERNRFGVLSYQGALGTTLDYQVSLFTRSTDVHYRPDAVGDLQYNGIAADILRRNSASGVQADLSWRLSASHTLRSGLFGQRERFATDNAASVFPADGDGNQTSSTPVSISDNTRGAGHLWGAYLQDEWQPRDWVKGLTINLGARFDQVRTVVDESQLSPRLGVVYDVTPQLRVHAGYARYFTPPPTEKIDTTSVAKFVGTTNALPSDANTAVKSERSHYLDAGLALQLTPEWTLGLDAYYRTVRHLQDEGQFGNALIFSAFNFEQGRIGGLDLSASYKGKALTGYVNLGLTRARGKGIETGQFNFDDAELAYIQSHYVHLDHEQKLSGSAGISWRFAGGLNLGADALYGSGLRNGFANTAHLPSYTTVNLAASRGFDLGALVGKLDARVAVLNVADRSYQLRDGSGIGVGAPQFGLRRTVYVGVTKTF